MGKSGSAMWDGDGMILYQNHQWKVTKYGLETKKPASPYHFEAERLSELTERSGETLYDWPIHMAEKNWVDLKEFIDAFKKALGFHGYGIDHEMMAATERYAWRERGRR